MSPVKHSVGLEKAQIAPDKSDTSQTTKTLKVLAALAFHNFRIRNIRKLKRNINFHSVEIKLLCKLWVLAGKTPLFRKSDKTANAI